MTAGQNRAQRYHDPILTALVARRHAMGLTQAELAEMNGLSRSNIAEREKLRVAPNLATLRQWADALDCDIVLVPRSEPGVTDEAAGVRAHRGRVAKSAELATAVQAMTEAGASAAAIAARLGVSSRTVFRLRLAQRDVA